MSKKIEIRNPLEKVMERSGLRFELFCSKNVLKSLRQKKVFYGFFSLLCSLHLNVFSPPLLEVQCPNFLDFPNPRGKLMERNGLRFNIFAQMNSDSQLLI